MPFQSFDDVSLSQLESWYSQEADAYDLLSNLRPDEYHYHALNFFASKRYPLSSTRDSLRILCFGSSSGIELLTFPSLPAQVYLLDPVFKPCQQLLDQHRSVSHLLPNIDGKISLPSESLDLITCFGALHHIPNIRTILKEFTRLLKVDGHLYIREPISYMGESGTLRPGLTLMERGIPLEFLDHSLSTLPLSIQHRTFCLVQAISLLSKFLNIKPYNNKALTLLDLFLSQSYPATPPHYRRSFFSKLLAPASVFYSLRKT